MKFQLTAAYVWNEVREAFSWDWNNCVGYSSDSANSMIGQYHRLLQKTWNEQVDQKLFDVDLANLFAGKRTKELSVNVEDLLLTYAINTITFTWVQNEKNS